LDDAGALADVLALALFDDPVSLWAFPDATRRREILPAFMRVFVDAALRQGEAYTMDDLCAASLWFPPRWEMNEPDRRSRTLFGPRPVSMLSPDRLRFSA
jgi:hypothetical protein